MNIRNSTNDGIALPGDFDDVLSVFYGKATHPEDLNEVACNMAALLEDADVSVAQMERVLVENNVVTLTPDMARRLAAEAICLRREEGG
ncbi:MAG: hypothetical protein ACYSVY_27160 [Planctomycetota bacterium]|jgi:hypothetical protein